MIPGKCFSCEASPMENKAANVGNTYRKRNGTKNYNQFLSAGVVGIK